MTETQKVRVLDTAFAQQAGLPVGELMEVVKTETLAATGSTAVRVKHGKQRLLLINDAIDTEYETVS